MVVTPSKKCCAVRVFAAKDKVSGMFHVKAFQFAKAADTRAFLGYLMAESEGQVKSAQSDNGSEFKAAFEIALKEQAFRTC